MNDYLLRLASNKLIMKILMKYMKFFQEGSKQSYILLFVKYIPLVIVTHEWKTQKNYGLNTLFGKLTISNYVNKETDPIFTNLFANFFSMLNIAVFFILVLSYSKLTSFDMRLKIYKVLFLKSLNVLCFLNFFCSQYFYELCTLVIAKNWLYSVSDSILNKTSLILKIVSISISLATFSAVLVQNYIFTLMNFRPYYVKKTYYANRINGLSYKNIKYPLLMVIVALEPYVSLIAILYIKMIFRAFYIYHFIIILMSSHLKQYYLELFLSSFCFVSVLVEFFFIKQFFDIQDETDFSKNPQNYSTLYNTNFFLSKLFLQSLLGGIICMMAKIYERNFITNFFKNIKGKFIYCFYNKNFEFLTKLKNGELMEDIISAMSKNINIHIAICNNSDCLCSKYKKNIIKEDNFDSKIFVKTLIELLEINLKESLKRFKHSNSETYTKYLMIETIYSLHFQRHYAKCLFNIEKMQRQSFYKNNFNLQIQVFWLKYEVIADFIKLNKTSSLATFRRMRENYEKYNTYRDLEIGFIKIFDQYKNLITLFYAKHINFSDFHGFLKLFFESIFQVDKLIRFTMANQDQHNSLHIRKIELISKFLKGENTYIPSHKMDEFLTLTKDDKSEKLIVKHTNKKEFLIVYISPKIAEQLSLKTSEIIGNDFHKYMPPQFFEFHYSHIIGHIKNNMLTIKNKEIYFVDKHGYCVNYFLDGNVLITLTGEILVYLELKSVCEEYNKRNVSFFSCDEEGEIIAINKKFADNFYIDVDVKNVVQPNVFKNILNINKNKLNFVNNQLNLKFSYSNLIKNIRAIDYSKIWDFNNNSYFKYLENLNKDKYANFEKVDLHFQILRRNLKEKFFFYDFKINIFLDDTNKMSDIFKNIARVTPIKNTNDTATETETFKDKNSSALNSKKTATMIKNDLNKIKTFSVFMRRWGKKMICNPNVNQKYLKEKLEKIDLAKIQKFKYSNSFLRIIIFLLLILGLFLFLGDFISKVFYQVDIFSKMRLKIFKLKQKNYYIINSIYSINAVTGQLQPEVIKLKNLNYTTNIDNSILYHLNSLKTRRDHYQEDFYNLHNYYLKLDKFLMDKITDIFNTKIEFKSLGNDWSTFTDNTTYFDLMEYDYRGVSKILSEYSIILKDKSGEIVDYDKTNKILNKFLTYDPSSFEIYYQLMDKNNASLETLKNKKDFPPTLRDKNIFYFLENSLEVFRLMYDKMRENFDEVFISLVTEYRTKLTLMFIIFCVLLILFFIYEGINFYLNYNKLFEKYLILYEILEKYRDELYIKVELLQELFADFTDSNRLKYLKISCDDNFMKKKLSKSDTFKESYADVKKKIWALSESKSSIRKSLLSSSFKTNRLLDYNKNNDRRKVGANLFQGNASSNLAKLLDTTNKNNVKILINGRKFKESQIDDNYFNYSDLNNIKSLTKIENELDNNDENLNNVIIGDKEKDQEAHKVKLRRSNIIKEKNENKFNENAASGYSNKNDKILKTPSYLIKTNSKSLHDNNISDKNLHINNTLNFDHGNFQKKQVLSFKKSMNKKEMKNNKIIKDWAQASTLSTFNKTDSNFLPNTNIITNLNKDGDSNYFKNEENENQETVKKSKKFYFFYSLFWIQLILIFSLIIVKIDNTGKRFEKIRIFNEYSEMFYKRIILSTEILMIYQMSLFKKKSDFLIEQSDIYLDKVYNEFRENEKRFLTLNNNYNEILMNLKDLEAQINVKDNFCNFISENITGSYVNREKTELESSYFDDCQRVSHNFFSVGFSKAMENLYNYMNILNKDIKNFFKDVKNGKSKFTPERDKQFLNDFYHVFSSVNQDQIIYYLYDILDTAITTYETSLKSELQDLNNIYFYSLYVLIFMLGIFSICMNKNLILDSDKLIKNTTDVVENAIKFTNKN